MEPEGSSPYLQQPATCPYPEWDLPRLNQSISQHPRTREMFRKMVIFYDEQLLAPRPTSNLNDHPLSAVLYCLFSIFAATLHILHPQPEDAPCPADKDPLVTEDSR
jgi:hypothetical protein